MLSLNPIHVIVCVLIHYTMYDVHVNTYTIRMYECSVYTCSLYSVYTYSVYTYTKCRMSRAYTVQCTVYIVHRTVYSVHCTMYTVHCTMLVREDIKKHRLL